MKVKIMLAADVSHINILNIIQYTNHRFSGTYNNIKQQIPMQTPKNLKTSTTTSCSNSNQPPLTKVTFPQSSGQYWSVYHKILKRRFTLKKIKIGDFGQQNLLKTNTSVNSTRDNRNSQLQRQLEILKKLPNDYNPRCQKLITTNNNLYVIFDQFPSSTLAGLIEKSSKSTKNQLETNQKISLFNNLIKGLSYFHTKNIAVLNFTPNNIYFRQNMTVLFSQWSLAVELQGGRKRIPTLHRTHPDRNYLAPQLFDKGQASFACDVYTLGMIFFDLLKILSQKKEEVQFKNQVSTLVQSMIHQDSQRRPSLQTVSNFIQNLNNVSQVKSTRGTSGEKLRLSPYGNQKSQFNLLKSAVSQKLLHPGYSPRQTQAKKKTPNRQEKSPNIKSPSQKPKQTRQAQLLIKQLNIGRTFCRFLMQLSQYTLQMSPRPELSYILAKYAYLTLLNIINKCQKQQSQGNNKQKTMLSLLKLQRKQIKKVMQTIQINFAGMDISQKLQKQFANEANININLLQTSVRQFGQSIMLKFQQQFSQIKTVSNSVEMIFNTYMVLKIIEEGTYDKFWRKIYKPEYLLLENQPYFSNQKKLGFRYIRNKIMTCLKSEGG